MSEKAALLSSSLDGPMGASPAAAPNEDAQINRLPSPLSSTIQTHKKRSLPANDPESEPRQPKQPKSSHEHCDPVAYWTRHLRWPPDFWQRGFAMGDSLLSDKRKSESTHQSGGDRHRFAEHRVYMDLSRLMQKSSRELCDALLKGDAKIVNCSPYPQDRFLDVLDRAQSSNEARLQRDITPWVVPPAELLRFCGESGLDYIGDEVDVMWSRCEPMGGPRPKPDYAAGLLPRAFTPVELSKLTNYAVPRRPAFFTPDLCFPFLVCEVKSKQQGLDLAATQTLHSGSIAVRAIIELYRLAFGGDSPKVKDLSGKVLTFSVSHGPDIVQIHCHYAILSEPKSQTWSFRRNVIRTFSLSESTEQDMLDSYKFVRNVYERFVPEHLARIRHAVAALPEPSTRTSMSFGTAVLSMDASNPSQQGSQSNDDSAFQRPGTLVSVNEDQDLKQQLEDFRLQQDALLKQLAQQREDNEKQQQLHAQQLERITALLDKR